MFVFPYLYFRICISVFELRWGERQDSLCLIDNDRHVPRLSANCSNRLNLYFCPFDFFQLSNIICVSFPVCISLPILFAFLSKLVFVCVSIQIFSAHLIDNDGRVTDLSRVAQVLYNYLYFNTVVHSILGPTRYLSFINLTLFKSNAFLGVWIFMKKKFPYNTTAEITTNVKCNRISKTTLFCVDKMWNTIAGVFQRGTFLESRVTYGGADSGAICKEPLHWDLTHPHTLKSNFRHLFLVAWMKPKKHIWWIFYIFWPRIW